MKKLSFYLMMVLMVPTILFTSCKDDAETKDPAFDVLKTHLVAEGMDLDHVMKTSDGVKFVVPAPEEALLADFLAKYYIMDIRSAENFDAGHIEGAVNVPFGDILTAADNADGKQLLTVCYSGQTACYAASLLRMYGHHNAQALKWGMSGWSSETAGAWNNNIGNVAEGHANWTTNAAPTNITFTAPDFSAAAELGEDILKERVEAVVAEGFKSVAAADVIDQPSAYFINNYFSAADYTGFGHIDGAYRINPLLLSDESVLNLNPEAKVVTYCYTGQTSAVITAFLNVMGYEAYSLLFGMNKLNNDNAAWTSNQWGGDSNSKELPVVQ